MPSMSWNFGGIRSVLVMDSDQSWERMADVAASPSPTANFGRQWRKFAEKFQGHRCQT